MSFMTVVYIVGAVIAAAAVLAIAKKVLKLVVVGVVAAVILVVGSAHGWVPKSAVPAQIGKLVPTGIARVVPTLPHLPGLNDPTTSSPAHSATGRPGKH